MLLENKHFIYLFIYLFIISFSVSLESRVRSATAWLRTNGSHPRVTRDAHISSALLSFAEMFLFLSDEKIKGNSF